MQEECSGRFWEVCQVWGRRGCEDAPGGQLKPAAAGQEHPNIPGATLGTEPGQGGSDQPEDEGRAGAQRVQITSGVSAL